jgi:Putative Ig domain
VKRLKQACCVLTVGLAALTAAVATAVIWPDPAAAAEATTAATTEATAAADTQGGSCNAVAGAYQFGGADGVSPAAWTGAGLTVPACGPIPNDGGPATPVAPYPGALKTPGYQCVEFSERYLFYRYGVTMGISTDGDQVAEHYAATYPALFMIVKSGTPNRAPVPGDVLSMAKVPGFDGADGGHTAVAQASSVNSAGNGTVTIVEENAVPSGVQVLPVSDWNVTYDGFPYLEWLTTAGMTVTTPTLPSAAVSRPYSARLTTAGGNGADRWAVTAGSLPPGLTLSAGGVLSGTISAATASGGDLVRSWPFTVTATDVKGAAATAGLRLAINGSPDAFYYDSSTGSLRDALWASDGWTLTTLDGPSSTLAGHTADHVGSAISAVVVAGEPEVFYDDATSASLRWARLTAAGWQFETLDGPGSALYQHTWHHVGSSVSAVVVDGAPQVYYYDSTVGALHCAWWKGSRWFFLTIDGPTARTAGHTGFRVGSAVSATVLGGRAQVYYDDGGGASLRYAEQTAAGWRFETLDGPSSTLPGHTADHVGSAVSVTQMNGNAQVYYYDATRRSLRHAWWTGSAWQFETLDGPGSVIAGHDGDQVGSAVSVTEMTNGPQVYYTDATAHSLRHAWWTSDGWHFETLDGPGSTLSGRTGDQVGATVAVTDY